MKKAFVFFGILLGLLFILLGTFNSQREENLTDDIVALVDNHPILRSDLDLALEALSMNKENPLTDEQIRLVRERLIDEQLLLQRGIDLNLHQTSNPIRKLIVNSMIDSILSENNDFLLEDSDLESFYNDNISFFLPAKQLRLRRIFIQFRSQEEDEEKLDAIRSRLIDGEDFEVVSNEEGDKYLPEIPDTFLPERKLKDYMDPVLVKNAFNLKDGQITSEIETKEGYNFLYLVESEKGEPLPFIDMKSKVKGEYIRRKDEEALLNYLTWLRKKYNIIYNEKINE